AGAVDDLNTRPHDVPLVDDEFIGGAIRRALQQGHTRDDCTISGIKLPASALNNAISEIVSRLSRKRDDKRASVRLKERQTAICRDGRIRVEKDQLRGKPAAK